MKSIARILVFSLLVPVLASAHVGASVNGGWAAPLADGESQPPVMLSLTEADGGVLTGSVILPGGIELSIQEGTVSATQIEFKTTQRTGDESVVWKWIGTVKGDEIAFTRATGDGQGTPEEIVVTRKK